MPDAAPPRHAVRRPIPVLMLVLAGCAYEQPPMNPDDPGTVRPMRQQVYQQTFPPGGTPAQGLRVGEPPVNAVPSNAPVNQPGNRP